jgi:hypothetical protein
MFRMGAAPPVSSLDEPRVPGIVAQNAPDIRDLTLQHLRAHYAIAPDSFQELGPGHPERSRRCWRAAKAFGVNSTRSSAAPYR